MGPPSPINLLYVSERPMAPTFRPSSHPEHPMTLHTVASLNEAARRLREGCRADALLLDVAGCRSNDDAFADAQAILPWLPIVAVVDGGDEAAGLQAIHAGAQDFLFDADFDSPAIARIVSCAVERARAGQVLRGVHQDSQRHYAALRSLTCGGLLQISDVEDALRIVIETAASALHVDRVGIWRFDAARRAMVCRDLFDSTTARHSFGHRLDADRFPAYFRALAEHNVVAAADACHDNRTQELAADHLKPLGIVSRLDSPIMIRGRLEGVVSVEHVSQRREWTSAEQGFAVSVANLVSLLLAQHAQSKSESRLRTIVESEPECVTIVSRRGRVLDMNPAGLRMIEADGADQVVGSSIFELIHPDDAASFRHLHESACAGATGRLQFRTVGLRGNERWMEAYSTPLRELDGSIDSVLSVTRDITERRQNDERLALLDFALNHAREAAYLVGEDSRFVDVNQEACRALGLNRMELLKMGVVDIDPYFPMDQWRAHWKEIREKGTVTLETFHRRHDGHVFPVEVSANYFEYGGRGYNLALVRDITERRRNELLQSWEARVLEMISAGSPLETVLLEVALGAERVMPGAAASISVAEPGGLALHQIAAPSLPAAFRAALEHIEVGPAGGSCAVAAYRRKSLFSIDIDTDPIWATLRELAGRHSLRACWSTPVKDSSGGVIATFALYFSRRTAPKPHDHELLGRTAHVIGIAIERDRREKELQASEARFRRMFTDAATGIVITAPDGRIQEANAAYCKMLGYSAAEIRCRAMSELLDPVDQRRYREVVRELAAGVRESAVLQLRFRHGTGSTVWGRVSLSAQRDAGGRAVGLIAVAEDTTEQKQAEERERKMADRLASTLESITDAFCTLDRNWRYTYLNREAERVLERSRDELLGAEIWERFPSLAGSNSERQLRRAMAEQVMVEFEDYFEPLNSWFDVRIFPTPEGLAVYFRDITEVRSARDSLRASEARFREMAENIQEVFYSFDPVNGRMLYVSPGYAQIWGRTLESLYDDPVSYLEAVHPDDRDGAVEAHRRHLSGEVTNVQYRIIRPDGAVRWMHDHTFPIKNAEGVVERVVGTAQDITDRMLAIEAMRVSEERFRLLAKATRDAIRDWDMITNSLWWNEGFETMFGFSRDEVEPSLDSWCNRIHPDDRDEVLQSLHATLDANELTWSHEYRFLKRDGGIAHVLDRGYVIRDAAGQPVRMIGGMTDITERKNLESQLLQSQKMEAIGQLAGGVAHDFNNLLSIIFASSENMLELVPEGDPMQMLLGDIQDASRRAANLTRQLLAFSRRQALDPQVLDVNDVVRDVEKMLRRLIGERIELRCELASDLWPVRVDPVQLQQIIINLAVNARDAMPEGGRLTVETQPLTMTPDEAEKRRDCPPGEYVALTLADTGCGMPPDVRSRIFEPFFTTKEFGKGTGLGLPTVFGIVKQSQGLIDVASEEGAGSVFRILLPAVVPEGAAEPGETPQAAECEAAGAPG